MGKLTRFDLDFDTFKRLDDSKQEDVLDMLIEINNLNDEIIQSLKLQVDNLSLQNNNLKAMVKRRKK